MNATYRRANLKRIVEIVVSPTVFLATIWVLQFFAYTFFDTGVDAPSMTTWTVVFAGIVAFSAGAGIATVLQPRKTVLEEMDISLSRSGAILIKISIPFAIVSAAILVYRTNDQGLGLLSTLKADLLEESSSGNKSSVFFVYVIILNALCVLYYCNTVNFMNRKSTMLLVALTAILCLFSGSRALLIFFIVALFPALIFHQKKITLKATAMIILAAAVAFAFFFAYPILFQSFDVGSDGGTSLKNYLSVYLFSGIGAFGHFINTGEPSYQCMLTIPRPFMWLTDFIISSNLHEACPVSFHEVDIPLNTNVYSIFFTPMHDFGFGGVAAYLFILGLIVNFTYLRGFFSNRVAWRFIYCIFFFSIFMSFFEDQFARGFIYYFFATVVLAFTWLIRKLSG